MATPHFLAQHTVLVTGAGQGIGAAIDFDLARMGAQVVVSDRHAAAAEHGDHHGADGVPARVARAR